MEPQPANRILIIAEHDHIQLFPSTLSVLKAATFLEGRITLLIAGFECERAAKSASVYTEIQSIVLADSPCYEHFLPENFAPLCAELGKDYDYILAPATTFGKNLLPRVAALLSVSQVSDVIAILSADTFLRPMYAGNVFATVQSLDTIKLLTIRPTAFDPIPTPPPAIGGEEYEAPIENKDLVFNAELSEFIRLEKSATERPELSTARVIIAGGRGLQSKENFKLLEKIADQLGAAIGASRAAVDAGFVPNDYQVGQTGKIVAPDLYIAVGISGAIQHLAGMKDSKIIVAINKDEDAPIFQIADYGLVGDLFSILPEFSQELTIRNIRPLVK